MADGNCPIWGTRARYEPKVGDYEIIDSLRVGGRYQISDSFIAILESSDLSALQRALLTSELISERISGNDLPKIGDGYIPIIKERRSLHYS